MAKSTLNGEISKWEDVIFDPDEDLQKEIMSDFTVYQKEIIEKASENLYDDLKRSSGYFNSPYNFDREFRGLTKEEKSVWDG